MIGPDTPPDVAGPSGSCSSCGATLVAVAVPDLSVRYSIAMRCGCGTVIEVWPATTG